jgi:hypothetical protein
MKVTKKKRDLARNLFLKRTPKPEKTKKEKRSLFLKNRKQSVATRAAHRLALKRDHLLEGPALTLLQRADTGKSEDCPHFKLGATAGAKVINGPLTGEKAHHFYTVHENFSIGNLAEVNIKTFLEKHNIPFLSEPFAHMKRFKIICAKPDFIIKHAGRPLLIEVKTAQSDEKLQEYNGPPKWAVWQVWHSMEVFKVKRALLIVCSVKQESGETLIKNEIEVTLHREISLFSKNKRMAYFTRNYISYLKEMNEELKVEIKPEDEKQIQMFFNTIRDWKVEAEFESIIPEESKRPAPHAICDRFMPWEGERTPGEIEKRRDARRKEERICSSVYASSNKNVKFSLTLNETAREWLFNKNQRRPSDILGTDIIVLP